MKKYKLILFLLFASCSIFGQDKWDTLHQKEIILLKNELVKTDSNLQVLADSLTAYKKTIEEYISDASLLCYVEQTTPMGTGHALMCCQDELQKTPNAKCLILSGDVPLIKTNMLEELVSNGHKTTLVTTEMKNPFGYGRIVTNNGTFQKIVEEKDASLQEKRINMVNAGIYCIISSYLLSHLSKLSNNNANKEYYLTDIIEIIRVHENEQIYLHIIHPDEQFQIRGVNTQEQLAELEEYVI